jgi:hypothetical protein
MQECKPLEYTVNKQDGDRCGVGNLSGVGHAAVVLATFKPSQVKLLFLMMKKQRHFALFSNFAVKNS